MVSIMSNSDNQIKKSSEKNNNTEKVIVAMVNVLHKDYVQWHYVDDVNLVFYTKNSAFPPKSNE